MVKGVNEYLAIVHGILAKYNHKAKRHVEVGFQLAEDMGGMADLVIQTEKRLVVLDYKNGYHPVNAEDNEQLAGYGVGALTKFAFDASTIEDVVMGVVQPNAEGPTLKVWTQTRQQMLEWRDKFESARYKCLQVEAEHTKGMDLKQHCIAGMWCKWCPAMVECPAMHEQTEGLVKQSTAYIASHMDVSTVGNERLLWIAEHGDNMIEFIHACRGHMTTVALQEGRKWPGFKVVEAVTKRTFRDKKALEKSFKENNQGEAFEPKLKALSKLEKLYGKETMAPFITKPVGSPVMVPDADGRPIYNQAILAQVPELDKGIK